MSSARDLLSRPDRESFTEHLFVGRLRWDLIHPFPAQPEPDRRAGDKAVREVVDFLTGWVDPHAVDAAAQLPPGLIEAFKKHGYLKLAAPAELGGRQLSPYNVFRVVEGAASWSLAAALVIAIDNAIGVSGFLPAVPPGPVRDFVAARVAASAASGLSDSEPEGASNQARSLTAVPVDDGAAYLLTGEKVFTGNGLIADVLTVTATVVENGLPTRRLFFVDTRAEGVTVRTRHEFMGIRGFPIASIGFTGVRVPREQMLAEPNSEVRLTPRASLVLLLGRLYLIAAPSLAFAKLSVAWTREFLRHRRIDGRPLGEYDEIQRAVATGLAETFAIETVAAWSLLADQVQPARNTAFEQLLAKNITSVIGWRVVDRAMSLLGAEGFETAVSKARRGAPPLAVERLFRDCRGLRISGGVDFQLDYFAGRLIFSSYYPDRPAPADTAPSGTDLAGNDLAGLDRALSPRNVTHARFLSGQAGELAEHCHHLRDRFPLLADLLAEERVVILTNQVLNEIVTAALTLSRAAALAAAGHQDAQDLADVYCTQARHRLADLWHQLRTVAEGPDHAGLSDAWLRGDGTRYLTDDDLVRCPPVRTGEDGDGD